MCVCVVCVCCVCACSIVISDHAHALCMQHVLTVKDMVRWYSL